jgi:hypothetical protein
LLFKNRRPVSPQSGSSNDQVENSFQSGCGADAISDQRILGWGSAVCELAYIHSTRFRAGTSLVGGFRSIQAMAAMSVVEGGKRTRAGRCSISPDEPNADNLSFACATLI